MNKKITKQVFTALLTTFCLTTSDYEGCFKVQGNTCLACLNRKPLGLNKGCGTPTPLPNNCLVYTISQVNGKIVCAQCNPGYALDLKAAETTTPCKLKSTIKNCVDSFQNSKGVISCAICSNEQYVKITKQDQAQTQCVSAGKAGVENCLWGGLFGADSFGATCYRCQPPFAASYDDRRCVKASVPGCLSNDQNPKTCFVCDVFSGYYMVPGGNCSNKKSNL